MADTYDVAVVGNGVLALAVAEELLHRGQRVAVVGAAGGEYPGQATRAAGAMLSTFSEVERGHPAARVAVETTERVAAHDAYPAWLGRITTGGPGEVGWASGTWVLAATGTAADLEPIAAAARSVGHPVEEHPATQIPGLRPACPGDRALWLPTEARVDTAALMATLAAAVRRHQRAVWCDTDATAVTGGRVDCANGSRLDAGLVVLAAGVATATLLPDRGHAVGLPPILAGRGASALLESPEIRLAHVVRTPNQAFACGAHLVPRGDGSLYLGATNRLTTDPDPSRAATLGELRVLIDDATGRLDLRLSAARLRSHRVGYRPYTLDHLPLIGRTQDPRLLVATATYRCGILLAPRLATLIADEIEHPGRLDDHPYRVQRPMPATTLTDVLDAGAARALLEHLQQGGAVLPAEVADQLAGFVDLALRHLTTTPAGSALARLWRSAPVEETVPALFALPARMNGARQ
jgi:glycine oxidase